MSWNDQSGGGGGQGPWGGGSGGPRRPWGQPPRQPPGGQGPDLEELLRRFRDRMRMGGGGGGAGRGGAARPFPWTIVLGVLVAGWLLTGIYTVDEASRGVILRFGQYDRTTPPGIHWHLPTPIETRRVENVGRQRVVQVGFVTSNEQTRDNPEESLMITGDRNIVEVRFRVVYNIKDVEDFIFNVRDTEAAVRAVAESAMREVIGRRQLEPIITTERAAIEQDVETLLQQVLDEYESGINIVGVELLRSTAPQAVIAAFNDVVIARADAETAINNANRETAQIVNAAEAYREQVVREATGEAERFVSVHTEYRQAPQVTRDRLYLETMERVYQRGNLVILDQRGGAVPYLPLEGMIRRNTPAPQPQPQPGGAR